MKILGWFCALSFAGLVPTPQIRAATFNVSPNTVSNSYAGYVTLQVGGIAAGHAVQVQKYLDANANGVIDAGDILRQQYTITDGVAGMVIGGVTNVNVPGDTDSTAGQITAQWNFATDNSQSIIGNYLFRCSSLSGDFATPFTNSFTVTNAAYFPSCTVTGNVVNAGTNVPNAVVLLLQAAGNNQNFIGGTMANNTGAYSIKIAPGTYTLLAAKSNFVANSATAPSLTLAGGQTITTNLTLTNTTQTISGKIVDAANSSVGLPGLVVPVSSSTNGWFALTFTDGNGNFTFGTLPDKWKFQKDETGVGAYGYLTTQNSTKVDTGAGSVSGVTISYPKATALFYGVVTNFLGTPFSGVDIFASDNNGQYGTDTRTDVNGYYTVGALCGTGINWQVHISDETLSALTNNIFSLPPVDNNGGTNLTCGLTASAEADFTAIYATNHVTGWIHDDSGNPLPNIQLYAYTTFGTVTYVTQATTDGSGNYWMNLGNGIWTVSINCCSCTDCGGGCLPTTIYQCPSSQSVTINNNNTNAYFTAVRCATLAITTPSPLPGAGINTPYSLQFTNNGCSGPFTWSACSGLPPGLSLSSSGNLSGTPTVVGSNYFCVQVMDSTSATTNAYFTLFVNRLTITTPSLFNGAIGAPYTNQLTADFGQPPYTWAFNSGTLPGGMGFSSAGIINGIPASGGTFNFNVGVTDSTSYSTNKSFSLLINPKSSAPPFRWAVKAGGGAEDQMHGLGVDGSGNAYIAGHFYSATATFGGFMLMNKGSADIFVAKFSNSGGVIWAKAFGAEGDDEGFGLACDTSGNSYVCGWFASTNIDFGTGPLTNALPGSNNVFVAKFNSSGTCLWAQRAGGAYGDQAIRPAVDTSGNCYVAGLFGSPTITFGGVTLTNAGAAGTTDFFLVKYDPSGNVLWARSAGGSDFDSGDSVAVDGSGNVYVTGQFVSTNFNIGGTLLTNSTPGAGSSDLFLAKYNSAGSLQWVRQSAGNGDEVALAAVDASSNSYLAGFFFGGTITLDGVTLTNTALDGSENYFAAKFNSAGTLQWARSAVSDSYAHGRGIVVDAAGNSYITGQFGSDSITFGNVTLMIYGSVPGPADGFVVKYDPSGNVLWAKRVGGSKGDQGSRVALDASGNLYVAGNFKSSNAQFDSTTLATSGNWDMFLALIDGSGPPLSIKLAGAAALLQWPTNRPGYLLESESTLTNPPAWTAVTNPVGTVADQNTVTNNVSGATKFYRLRSQ